MKRETRESGMQDNLGQYRTRWRVCARARDGVALSPATLLLLLWLVPSCVLFRLELGSRFGGTGWRDGGWRQRVESDPELRLELLKLRPLQGGRSLATGVCV